MSRILFLAPTLPWPQDSGSRIRTAQLLSGLRESHEVTLWCVERPGISESDLEHARELCSELVMFPRSKTPWLRSMSAPVESTWFYSESLRKALATLHRSSFELLHIDELSMMAMCQEGLATMPIVQHHHKLDLDLSRELQPTGPRQQLETQRWARLEEESLACNGQQVFCSHEDAARFSRRHSGSHQAVIANGVNCDEIRPTSAPREMDHLLWLGSTDYQPNVRGLLKFLDELWPSLLKARPNLRLSIVGRGDGVDHGTLPPGVFLVGAVPDVRPWLARVSGLVVPLEVGGGTRLKILEAAAAGCPIVTTRVGAEGLPFEHEVHILVAPDLMSLMQPLLRCLTRPTEAQTRSLAARDLVERDHHWPAIAQQLAGIWQSLIRS